MKILIVTSSLFLVLLTVYCAFVMPQLTKQNETEKEDVKQDNNEIIIDYNPLKDSIVNRIMDSLEVLQLHGYTHISFVVHNYKLDIYYRKQIDYVRKEDVFYLLTAKDGSSCLIDRSLTCPTNRISSDTHNRILEYARKHINSEIKIRYY